MPRRHPHIASRDGARIGLVVVLCCGLSCAGTARVPGLALRDALSVTEAVKLPRSSAQVLVHGFLWEEPPPCSPCPEGADCAACLPPFYKFSARPRGQIPAGGPPVLLNVISFAGETSLNPHDHYLLRGWIGRKLGEVVLHVEAITKRDDQ